MFMLEFDYMNITYSNSDIKMNAESLWIIPL